MRIKCSILAIVLLAMGVVAFAQANGLKPIYSANPEDHGKKLGMEPIFKPYSALSAKDKAVLRKFGVEQKAREIKKGMLEVKELSPFSLVVGKVDMNGDKIPDYIIRYGSGFYYGNAGFGIDIYTSQPKGKWLSAFHDIPAITVTFSGKRTKGYLDLWFGGPGFKFLVWKWDGRKYAPSNEWING